jgi:hypothetical protein
MTIRLTIWRHPRFTRGLPILCAAVALLAGTALAEDEPKLRPATGQTINGKAVADLPIWKRVTLGTHKGVNSVRAALDSARMRVGDSADEILGRPGFTFSRSQIDVSLVVLTLADLGFEKAAPLAQIYRRAAQLGLELCPAEVGPLLRLQYVNQPLGEFLRVAMRPIATYGGEPVDLTLANAGTGLLLIGGESKPDLMLQAGARFVFVRPDLIAMPSVP